MGCWLLEGLVSIHYKCISTNVFHPIYCKDSRFYCHTTSSAYYPPLTHKHIIQDTQTDTTNKYYTSLCYTQAQAQLLTHCHSQGQLLSQLIIGLLNRVEYYCGEGDKCL